MNFELTDEETAALLRELDDIIDGDRYFLSARIKNKLPCSIGSFAPAMTLSGIELSANGSIRPFAVIRTGVPHRLTH
jgi:hypothetical protein